VASASEQPLRSAGFTGLGAPNSALRHPMMSLPAVAAVRPVTMQTMIPMDENNVPQIDEAITPIYEEPVCRVGGGLRNWQAGSLFLPVQRGMPTYE